MTRFEKEKILLMCLGLSEGDKITFTDYNSKVNGKVVFKIGFDKEAGNFKLWSATDEVKGWLYITDLIKYNFKKVKTLGSIRCIEMECDNCPLKKYICQGGLGDTLNSCLETTKNHNLIDNIEYEQIKKELDKEVKE